MTEARHRPRILTIPPGLAFLETLCASLCDGRLTPDFRYDPADPLSLARVTIYVPTRRAARVLRSHFVDYLGGRSAILPVIRPLGETDEDGGYFEEDLPAIFDLSQPLTNTARLLELARLVLAWRNRLPDIVRSIHSETPLIAPASPADAIWLARSLAELIDAIETEERDWTDMQTLQAQDHALWWQLTAQFLDIASAFWPARLVELRRSSPARHRTAVLRAEAARIAGAPLAGPVVIAGSTGSIPATAELMAAVVARREGVIVLPGLDLSMPEEDWQLVAPIPLPGKREDPASRSHPQYGLAQLLRRLKATRDDVSLLAASSPVLARRAEILSRALLPAEATDRWNHWRTAMGDEALAEAFATVSLIEATNEREEATAIALALKLALHEGEARDGEESRAALITPDRDLARRVTAELARFGIIADDSAGTPLAMTSPATLMQLLLEATLRPGDAVALVGLLKHPLARFGLSEKEFCRAAEALEILALRGGVGEFDIESLEPLLEERLADQQTDRHAPRWRLSLEEGAAEAARDLARRISKGVEPLLSAFLGMAPSGYVSTGISLADWASRTGRALEAAAMDESGNLAGLWGSEAGDALAALLQEVIETDGRIEADGAEWIDITAALLAGQAVKPRALSHPRIFIYGTMEARLQHVDTVIVGGLNEGAWPGQTANNPFLSRGMKTEIGLEPPERRIGQLAHDFEMASGMGKVIYTRALRQGSTPTVASRWLQRLLALGGPQFERALKARGQRYIDWANLIDRGPAQAPAQRPAPRPPAELQPRSYSFSEVGRLRRDPYSVYARRILRLDAVAPFNCDPGLAERGTLYHQILDRFIREGNPTGPAGMAAIERIADELFDLENLPHHIDAVWRPRFREVARSFLDWEAKRRPLIRRSLTEVRGGFELEPLGIRITGVADRIDLLANGQADIIDYKTGSSPTMRQARSLLDPQLSLEAAALRAGAFKAVGSQVPRDLIYVRLRPAHRFDDDIVNNENDAKAENARSALQFGEEALQQFGKFVSLLMSGQQGFSSRLIPAQERDYGGDYDHLARVAEWSTADAEEGPSDE